MRRRRCKLKTDQCKDHVARIDRRFLQRVKPQVAKNVDFLLLRVSRVRQVRMRQGIATVTSCQKSVARRCDLRHNNKEKKSSMITTRRIYGRGRKNEVNRPGFLSHHGSVVTFSGHCH